MTLLELSYVIQEAIDDGYGELDVMVPSQTGGYQEVSDLDMDTLEEDLQVLLS